MKLVSFIVSMLFVCMVAGILVVFMGEVHEKYNPTYDNESQATMVHFQRLNNLTSDIEDIQEASSEIDTETSPTDILGSFFKNGYRALKVGAESIKTFFMMMTGLQQISDYAGVNPIIITTLILMMIVAIFIGIIASAILKWQV